jgi:hypothetical protein
MNICKICTHKAVPHFVGEILNKYTETYYKCTNCGFIQLEAPYWLAEAYGDAITKQDIGLVNRNISMTPIVSCLISFLFNKNKKFIDYGGGYGLLTRMMRDRGYDFYRFDTYCENLFARNFDRSLPSTEFKYELLTAFELFEHLVDPVHELREMLKWSDNIFFSTNIQIPDLKSASDWWYVMPETGQHIALYTTKSLQILAEDHGLNFYTNGIDLHLFTTKKISKVKFRILTKYRCARFLDHFASKNGSLTLIDSYLSKA